MDTINNAVKLNIQEDAMKLNIQKAVEKISLQERARVMLNLAKAAKKDIILGAKDHLRKVPRYIKLIGMHI